MSRHRQPGTPPTANQIEQLRSLRDAGARSEAAALDIYQLQDRATEIHWSVRANPNIIGALRDKGLADSKVRTGRSGQRCTHYWITAEGVAAIADFKPTRLAADAA